MKIKTEHYYRLCEIFPNSEVLDKIALRYKQGDFARADKCKDLKMRFCFDIFSMCIRDKPGLLNDLYKYMNDENIYTALKKILGYQIKTILEVK